MKKIYSLLLLGGLLLLGAQNALGTNYLRGSWYSDWYGIAIADNTDVEVFLAYNTEYSFEIANAQASSGDWRRVNTTQYTATGSQTLSAWDGVCSIKTGAAGIYKFKITSWDNGNPVLSITYPANPTSYVVYFDETGLTWGQKNAHIYTSDDKNITGSWPGKEATLVSGSIYKVEFESAVAPANIIWSNNGENQLSTQSYINGVIFDKDGNKFHQLSLTAGKWASFCPSIDVTIPSGVTAYKGAVSGSDAILTDIEQSTVNAGVGVILKASADGTYTFSSTSGAAFDGNALQGTTVRKARNLSKVTYALYTDGEGVQKFTKYVGDYIPTNKAYFELEGEVSLAPDAFRIVDGEDEATDIKAFEASDKAMKFIENGKLYIQKNDVVYDATGRIVK